MLTLFKVNVKHCLKCWHCLIEILTLFDILTFIENGCQGRKGELEEGFDADLVIFAPDKTQLVRFSLVIFHWWSFVGDLSLVIFAPDKTQLVRFFLQISWRSVIDNCSQFWLQIRLLWTIIQREWKTLKDSNSVVLFCKILDTLPGGGWRYPK